jgi:O-antigen/teichoic acid export membrane protein
LPQAGEYATPGRADARQPRRSRSFFSDVLSTTAVQALTALLNVIGLAIISRRLGEADLGLYTLERRSVALLVPIFILGVNVAAPRYIALALGRRSGEDRSYAFTASLLVAGAAALIAVTIAAFPRPAAALFFGDAEAVALSYALAGLALVTAPYVIMYSLFRGYMNIGRANALELSVVGLVPVIVGLVGPTDFVAFMWTLNGGVLACVMLSVVGLGWHERPPLRSFLDASAQRARELLRFGLARTPGDLALVALFAAAPIVVVHHADAVAAGHTSVVQSSLNLVTVVAGPLGVLLLPRVALELGSAGGPSRERYTLLAQATLDFGFGLGALLFLASPVVVAVWFPSLPHDVVVAERVIALGVPAYVFYLIFRSYLDALETRPLSGIATVIGLAGLAVSLPLTLLSGVFAPTVAASVALTFSVTAMGAAVFVMVRSRLAGLGLGAIRDLVLPCGAILALGLLLRDASLVLIAAATAFASLAYGGVLVALHRDWLVELRGRVGLLAHSSGTGG